LRCHHRAVVRDDLLATSYALVADEDLGRTCNKALDCVLRFAAERAVVGVMVVSAGVLRVSHSIPAAGRQLRIAITVK
jgi:hypothetical protein